MGRHFIALCNGPVWLIAAGLVQCLILLTLTPSGHAATTDGANGLADGVSQSLVLAPGKDNPRNSEGDFIRLKDGRILFIYTHFTSGAADDADAYLASRFSVDGGASWSAQDQVVAHPPGVSNIMSVSLLRLHDGRIALFYMVKRAALDAPEVMSISTDEARTWSAPTVCMPEAGYYVVNNGRVVQLESGRLVIPAARHDLPKDGAFHRGFAMCFISDDIGKTWHQSKSALEAPAASLSGLQEPLVVELKGGKLMMLARTDQGSQYRSTSDDGGETWSPAVASDLRSPLSPASIRRIPKTGDLLLVWNDHSRGDLAASDRRTPLTVVVSSDEGITWQHRKTLYDDPLGWYCYTAIAFAGDRVLLGHCAGKQTGGTSGLATTVITTFGLDWLYRDR